MDFATPIGVYRYDSTASSGQRYTFLPNVRCEQIQEKEGAEPSTAQFSYILSDTSEEEGESPPDGPPTFHTPYPSQFEDLWPIQSADSHYKVKMGDRLVVLAVDPGGAYRVRWDGFAQVPQVDLSPGSQAVHFVGVDVAVRLWDKVVAGRRQRNGDAPSTPGGSIDTDLETHFNPDDKGNCTPDDSDETLDPPKDSKQAPAKYPIFLDQGRLDLNGDLITTFFDLSKSVRYLLALYNDQKYVDNPDFSVLDTLLKNRQPNGEFYDPGDPSTYTDNPVVIRDYDATNKPPMDVIEALLGYADFRIRFVTEGVEPDEPPPDEPIVEEPHHYIEVYRFDAAGPTDAKDVSLPYSHSELDTDQCNVSGFNAVNDFHSLANDWDIETKPIRYEGSFILAPGFKVDAADADNTKQFLLSALDNAPQGIRDKYRLYVADECADGFWDLEEDEWVDDQPFDFSDMFLPEDAGLPKDSKDKTYVNRYRPGINKLFSLDPAGKPYKAQLAVSRDYEGESPALWNQNGTWQVIDGGFRLLRDRLGIYIDIENPDEWDIGKSKDDDAAEPSGVLQGIHSIAAPSDTVQRQKRFWLRLTCVIESDRGLDTEAKKRTASPYPFSVMRRIDAKDHFKKEIVDSSSMFNSKGKSIYQTDDTTRALTYAYQLRTTHEFPPLAGSITLPWFSWSYGISDRLKLIKGRDVDLRVNAGSEQSEEPSYPFVVGIAWSFQGNKQTTALQLSDRRSEPQRPR